MFDILQPLEVGNSVWISGCPGIGKSTALFGWLNLPGTAQRGYLWIHFGIVDVDIVYRRATGETLCWILDIDANKVVSFISNLIRTVADVRYIVLDGVLESSLFSRLFATAAQRLIVSAIACTCNAAYVFDSAVEARLRYPEQIVINSWSWEDYVAAYEAKTPALIDKFSSITEMNILYQYAGGSMRYMLWENLVSMRRYIDAQFDRVSDYGLLMKGLQDDESRPSVNSIMQLIDLKSYPLSSYVYKLLMNKVDDSFFLEGESVWRYNPSVMDLLFELKLIRLIKRNLKTGFSLNVKSSNADSSTTVSWPAISGIVPNVLSMSEIFEKVIPKKRVVKSAPRNRDLKGGIFLPPPDIWIEADTFNNTASDLCYYHRRGHVDFFQFTIAETHKYNISQLIPLVDKLCTKDGNSVVNLYVVIPSDMVSDFRVQPEDISEADKLRAYDHRWSSDCDVNTPGSVSLDDDQIVNPQQMKVRNTHKSTEWAQRTYIKILYHNP